MATNAKVSRACEVVRTFEPLVQCGAPTTHWYPAVGGTMALCAQHAAEHPEASPLIPPEPSDVH
jgi:hypothetical protein